MAWSARPDGSAEFFNQHYLDYVGLSVGHSDDWDPTVEVSQVLGPDRRGPSRRCERPGCHMAGHIGFRPTRETEARLRRFDGKYRWFLFRANPLRDESGNIVKWYGTNTDIDDRKRAEEALRASESQSRLIVDTIPGLVAVFGPNWRSRTPSTGNFSGISARPCEEFANWATNGTVHPDDLPRHIETLAGSLASGDPIDFETRLRRFDGAYRWFQLRGHPARGRRRAHRPLVLPDERHRRSQAGRRGTAAQRGISGGRPTSQPNGQPLLARRDRRDHLVGTSLSHLRVRTGDAGDASN